MVCNSATQKNELLIHSTTKMSLENMMLSEIIFITNYILYDSMCLNVQLRKVHRDRNRLVVLGTEESKECMTFLF